MFKSTAIGIDIGAYSVKIVELSRSGKSYYVSGLVKLKIDNDSDSEQSKEQLALKIFNAMKAADVKSNSAVLGVPQKSMILSPVRVPMAEPQRVKKMLEFEMEQMSEQVGNTTGDYKLLNLNHLDGEYAALIGLARNDDLSDNYKLMDIARVIVKHSTIGSIAIFNLFKNTSTAVPGEQSLLVNIGEDYTDLAICDGRDLVFARSIGFGGKQFADAVAISLDISNEEARAMIIEQGNVTVTESDDQKIVELNQALRHCVTQLVSHLQNATKFASAQYELPDLNVDKLYLSGGISKLHGLDEFLASETQMTVEFFNPFAGFDSSQLDQNITELPSDLAVATGLAYIGLDDKSYFLDLLPKEVKQRREFLTRNLFMYIATACILILSLLSIYFNNTTSAAAAKEKKDRAVIRNKLDQEIAAYNHRDQEKEALLATINELSSHAYNGQVDALEQNLQQILESISKWPSVKFKSITVQYVKEDIIIDDTKQTKKFPIIILDGVAKETKKEKVTSIYNSFKSSLEKQFGDKRVSALPNATQNKDSTIFNFKFQLVIPIEGADNELN